VSDDAAAIFFPSLCRGDLGNECALIDMLLIDPIQAKLRMQSILGVGCLEMTKFRRRHTFRWAQVPAKDMFVLYLISQGNVVGIPALDQGHTSCFLGLLFSVCVYEPLTPFTLYDARIEIFKKVPFYSSESNLSSGHSKWLIFGNITVFSLLPSTSYYLIVFFGITEISTLRVARALT
jgi:hypothetical protein